MKKKVLALTLCLSILLAGCNQNTGTPQQSQQTTAQPQQSTAQETPAPSGTTGSESDTTSSTIEQVAWTGSEFTNPASEEKFEMLVSRIITNMQSHGIEIVGAEDGGKKNKAVKPVKASITGTEAVDMIEAAFKDPNIYGNEDGFNKFMTDFYAACGEGLTDRDIAQLILDGIYSKHKLWVPVECIILGASLSSNDNVTPALSGMYTENFAKGTVKTLMMYAAEMQDDTSTWSDLALNNYVLTPGSTPTSLSEAFLAKTTQWGMPNISLYKISLGDNHVVLPCIPTEEEKEVGYWDDNGNYRTEMKVFDTTDYFNWSYTNNDDQLITGTYANKSVSRTSIYSLLTYMTMNIAKAGPHLKLFIKEQISDIYDKADELIATEVVSPGVTSTASDNDYKRLISTVPCEKGTPVVWQEFVDWLKEEMSKGDYVGAWAELNELIPIEKQSFLDTYIAFCNDSLCGASNYAVLFNQGIMATLMTDFQGAAGNVDWALQWAIPEGRITVEQLRELLRTYLVCVGMFTDATYDRALDYALSGAINKFSLNDYVFCIDYYKGAAVLSIIKG